MQRKLENADKSRGQRFTDASRGAGVSEDEVEFDKNLRRLTSAKPDQMRPVGWYVRVTTNEMYDGVYNTVLYIAGYSTPAEAEEAVRNERSTPGETYEVLPGAIPPDRGPQPSPGEVRLLVGAV